MKNRTHDTYRICRARWPDLFVIGAPRSGTTFFYHLFKSLPEFFVCPLKEPNYFATSINRRAKLNKPIQSQRKYLALFLNARPDQILCETSPTYLWDPQAAANIAKVNPDAKLVAILRDPVHRAFSHYLMGLGAGYVSGDFVSALEWALRRPNDYTGRIAQAGFYALQLERYWAAFPKSQIKILIHEDFIKDEETAVSEVCQFAGMTGRLPRSWPRVTNTFDLPVSAVSRMLIRNPVLRWLTRELVPLSWSGPLRRMLGRPAVKPVMTREEWTFAEKIYRDEVVRLEGLLERKLPWLRWEE
ncbi:sulfotransferase family protein [Thiohalocapsa halophila]|nr:sulfotransferase [Thiohalocapsa halophila]